MKRNRLLALALAALLGLAPACAAGAARDVPGETAVVLSGNGVTVDGEAASTDPSSAVYVGAEIVYYHDGTDETYGEGTEAEKHSAQEAAAHTVVTITKPGTYRLSGVLPKGQIAVDLGKEAKDDPAAVVTLILDGADVTCTVAPALIFYNVYECDRDFVEHGDDPGFQGRAEVDTAKAGANVLLADGSTNTFTGSHVARIYKEGTTKKLHKYDGAFYSKMSMNIGCVGGALNCGVLNITGDNEGLNSELHLTVNGGWITINSQDDGINTNEDYVSVTTINGGVLTIDAGLGAEGDGIDSNGYLVINGGHLYATAHPAADGGIDAEMPIVLNGGTVIAQGGRNDEADAANSKQPFMQLTFAQAPAEGATIQLQSDESPISLSFQAARGCRSVTLTSPELRLDTVYHVYVDGALQGWSGNAFGMMHGGMGGTRPEGFQPGQRPQGMERPDAVSSATTQPPAGDGEQPPEPPSGYRQPPQGGRRPEGFDLGMKGPRPEGFDRGHGFDAEHGFDRGHGFDADTAPLTADFVLTAENRSFSGIRAMEGALPFVDLSPSDPAYDAVKLLYDRGAMEGTGGHRFSPHMALTRAQAITVLARLAGAEEAETNRFSDVAPGAWYAGYVGWAVDRGIVQGDGAGHFYPDMTVTAEQMELMLGRYKQDYRCTRSFQGELTRAQLAQMAADVLD